MNLGIIFADHVNHQCVDDEDDHRILVTKCGLRVGYTPPSNRQKSLFGDHVSCLECMTLDENVDPDQREREHNYKYSAAASYVPPKGMVAVFTQAGSDKLFVKDAAGNVQEVANLTPGIQQALSHSYNQGYSMGYRCNVPMCGESGVCEECRKRGAR